MRLLDTFIFVCLLVLKGFLCLKYDFLNQQHYTVCIYLSQQFNQIWTKVVLWSDVWDLSLCGWRRFSLKTFLFEGLLCLSVRKNNLNCLFVLRYVCGLQLIPTPSSWKFEVITILIAFHFHTKVYLQHLFCIKNEYNKIFIIFVRKVWKTKQKGSYFLCWVYLVYVKSKYMVRYWFII